MLKVNYKMSSSFGILSLFWLHSAFALTSIQEDVRLDTFSLINKYSYPAEIHTVETVDGYELSLHRIARCNATPVLLVHDLLDSSATWVMMGPNKSLGYLLYKQGYDVWMGNVRGNVYSRNHSTNQSDYWDFSFHEMGLYDLPTFIDYIYDTTGYERIHYIGHGQGATAFLVMGSERPQYMEKIILMQALGPMVYFEHTKSPVLRAAGELSKTGGQIAAHEFLPGTQLFDSISHQLCDTGGPSYNSPICDNALSVLTIFNGEQLNMTMLPVIIGHFPAGASSKQILHFGQLYESGSFQQFDYGHDQNAIKYGMNTPPAYKLENVKAKIALYCGENDWLAQPSDVKTLSQALPNVMAKHLKDFNHIDFVWAIDAQKLLWNEMISNMRTHENNLLGDSENIQ